jgi:hypothetical protein
MPVSNVPASTKQIAGTKVQNASKKKSRQQETASKKSQQSVGNFQQEQFSQ